MIISVKIFILDLDQWVGDIVLRYFLSRAQAATLFELNFGR